MGRRDGNAEARIQRSILEFLWAVAPQVKVFHVPNGAHLAGGGRAAARLKWQGMLPGMTDLLVIAPGGRVFAIEVKTQAGKLESEQEDFRDWCLKNSVPWMTARSVEDVRAALIQWQIPNRDAEIAA